MPKRIYTVVIIIFIIITTNLFTFGRKDFSLYSSLNLQIWIVKPKLNK